MSIAKQSPKPLAARRLAIIAAVDICEFSRLSERDSGAAAQAATTLLEFFETTANEFGGRVFNKAGDGRMAEFPSALAAVEGAVAFQEKCNAIDLGGFSMRARISIHAGDVEPQEDDDLLGHAVNVAARLQAHARPGGVIVTAVVKQLVDNSCHERFVGRRILSLHNIEDPITAYEIEKNDAHFEFANIATKYFRRLRANSAFLIVSAFCIFFAYNLFFQNLMREDPRFAALTQAQSEIEALENKISSLTRTLARERSDAAQRIAIRDAVESLLNSEIPEKRKAVALVEAGDVIQAAEILHEVYLRQTDAGTSAAARSQSLREIGVLLYYADTARALDIYTELYRLNPDDPPTVYQLGALHTQLNQPENARAYFVAVMAMTDADDPLHVAAQIGVGRIHLQTSDYGEAQRHLFEALQTARRNSFTGEEILAELKLGTLAYLMNDFEKSAAHRTRALVLARAEDNRYAVAEALNTLGTIDMRKGDYTTAARRIGEAVAIHKEMNDERGAASALTNLGEAFFMDGEIDEARNHFAEALDIASKANLPVLIALGFQNLARIAEAAGNQNDVCDLFRKAQEAFIDTPRGVSTRTQKGLIDNACATAGALK